MHLAWMCSRIAYLGLGTTGCASSRTVRVSPKPRWGWSHWKATQVNHNCEARMLFPCFEFWSKQPTRAIVTYSTAAPYILLLKHGRWFLAGLGYSRVRVLDLLTMMENQRLRLSSIESKAKSAYCGNVLHRKSAKLNQCMFSCFHFTDIEN